MQGKLMVRLTFFSAKLWLFLFKNSNPKGTSHKEAELQGLYFKYYDSETPNITFRVILLTLQNLWGHVDGGTHNTGEELPWGGNLLGKTKVTNFDSRD